MDGVSGAPPKALVDPFGRTVRDLRISVTDRCNFRCTYCMPEEGMRWLDRSELLTLRHRLQDLAFRNRDRMPLDDEVLEAEPDAAP